jgi:type VI secretion system protein ImpA
MTETLAATLSRPVDDAEPSGPDLDLAYDPDYANFVATAEGLLPPSFFEFKRAEVDLPAQCAAAEGLLRRTRDLRLLVLLAKFRILNRELAPFADALAAMAALLQGQWETVHPQGEDGDLGVRVAAVEGLNDPRHVILPLQHVPLVASRRAGPVSYRTHQIASGEIAAREGESTVDLALVEGAFKDGDLAELKAVRDRVAGIAASLAAMRAAVSENSRESVSFDRLVPAVERIRLLLERFVVARDPGAAVAPKPSGEPTSAEDPSPAAPAPAGALATPARRRAALDAVCDYFREHEPSSPALLLAGQARQLVGKSFADSVRLLVPNYSGDAVIRVGGRQVFTLPVERLADQLPADAGDEEAPEVEEAPMRVGSRREALALLQQIAVDVRAVEPSSPIPLLCDHARGLAERDFLSLLRDVLPSSAFINLDES